MRLALLHAREAAANAEVPVGAVLTLADGEVIAEASNAVVRSVRTATDALRRHDGVDVSSACLVGIIMRGWGEKDCFTDRSSLCHTPHTG